MISSSFQFIAQVEEWGISYFNDWAPFGNTAKIDLRRLIDFPNNRATLQLWRNSEESPDLTLAGTVTTKSIYLSEKESVYQSNINWLETDYHQEVLSIINTESSSYIESERIFKLFKDCWESGIDKVEERIPTDMDSVIASGGQGSVDDILNDSKEPEKADREKHYRTTGDDVMSDLGINVGGENLEKTTMKK